MPAKPWGGRGSRLVMLLTLAALSIVPLSSFGQAGEKMGSAETRTVATQSLDASGSLFPATSPFYSAALRSSAKLASQRFSAGFNKDRLTLDPTTISQIRLDEDSRYRAALGAIFKLGAMGKLPPEFFVYRGTIDTQSKYPDVVLIADSDETGICSGTIVGNGVVLTAMHCICDKISAKIGVLKQDGSFDVLDALGMPRQMKACGAPGAADVAIIFGPTSLRPSTGSPRFASASTLASSASGIIVGYGDRDIDAAGKSTGARGYGGVAIVTAACSAADNALGCSAGYEFIAGPTTDAHGGLVSDQCKGDSGGPLYVSEAGHLAIAGIASTPDAASTSSGGCGRGGIYERVDGDTGNWIRGVLASHAPS